MAKKVIVLNSKAFAYYFLQHYYRKNLETDFEDIDLKKFVAIFCKYASFNNKLLINEKGNAITTATDHVDFVNEIISKYTFSVEKNGRLFCRCFKSEILPNLREEYLHCDDNLKNLIIDYETTYMNEAYNNLNILMDIENTCVKNSDKNMKLMQEHTSTKGFDA
ncbi:MAG TPA: hypothetical protein DCO89_02500 [Clostridiales bacterium]|nr:hypothetical protein [Clostridiales bacterium]